MAEDLIRNYQDSLRKRQEAHAAAKRIVATVLATTDSLSRWETVRPDAIRIDMKNWPTAQELRKAIEDWRAADGIAHDRFNLIPADQRVGLVHP